MIDFVANIVPHHLEGWSNKEVLAKIIADRVLDRFKKHMATKYPETEFTITVSTDEMSSPMMANGTTNRNLTDTILRNLRQMIDEVLEEWCFETKIGV